MKKEVAGLARRAIAYIIDLFIIDILILKPFKLSVNLSSMLSFSIITKELVLVSISLAVLTLLYWSLLEFTVRQSIGKMITRIYVSSTQKQLSLKQCLIRNLSKVISIVLFFDVLYMLINKTHQRYFEKLSNTEVLAIKKEK